MHSTTDFQRHLYFKWPACHGCLRTLHLFQFDPTPQFPFLRHSLLASIQDPYRFFQGEILKPRPARHSSGVWLAAARYTFLNTSGSHVLDACLQTLDEVTWYRRPFNAHRWTLSQCLIKENKRFKWNHLLCHSIALFISFILSYRKELAITFICRNSQKCPPCFGIKIFSITVVLI